ncbi:RloB family protein [Streptomyces sp. NBC_00237]|uniref:RloB family protein n=1 Tax=Streptomyces sp. NBC_00237 TaxID=2975687 RepID=UPI0022592494|nr:RloB family protein [Streptomyces sp. NBC_00237]MCX5200268.1 RloB family protein [Streptomyces sp. NBC_00237]
MARTPKASGRRGPAFETDLKRRQGGRDPRKRLLVVCGARVTESAYLKGFKAHIANPAVSLKLVERPCAPSQLVTYTAELRDRSREDFDEAWCVFDVDEFGDVPDAVADAERRGIEVAVSNPCFELWLLLHFADHCAFTGSYAHLVPHLAKHLPRYDKTRADFRHFAATWPEAARRARALAPVGKEHEKNPASGVWRLVKAIAAQ